MTFRLLLVLCLGVPALAQTTADSAKPANPPVADAKAGAIDPLVSAQALLKKGAYEDAAAALKSIVEKNPTSAEAQAGLVRSLQRARNFDEAEEAGKKAVAAVSSSALVHAAFGDVNFRLGKFGEAEAEYRTALKLDANSAWGWLGMARMFEMVSMRKKAKDAFAKAHELDPENKQIYGEWLDTLSSVERLAQVTKSAGEHPTERGQARIRTLPGVAQKKPWVLANDIKPTEIKMMPYGRTLAGISTGDKEGAAPISKGYGLDVKFNDQVGAVLLLDTGAGGIVIGRKLAEKAVGVKIAGSYLGGIGDQGLVQGYIGWVEKIRIGNIEFKDCLLRVSSRNDVADETALIRTTLFAKFLPTLSFIQ